MNSSNITHTHTKDVMYLIRGIYNPTSYIDERGEENPNELYQTSRPKHLPKVPGEQVNWHKGRCHQPNPGCGNLYWTNNLEARGGGEQKGNLNNLCQPSVPYLILLPTEEGKKDNCEHWLDTNDIKVNIYAKNNKVKVKSLSRVQLCDPMDCSLPCSSNHGIFQARIPEWVAMPFSRVSSWSGDWTWVSHITGRLLPTEPPGKTY